MDSPFDRASFYYPSCTTTLDVIKPYIAQNRVAEGTVFITDYQSKGRAQRGASWDSQPAQNLLFTLILYPEWLAVDRIFDLNVVASLAVYDVLFPQLSENIAIKWPNDLYCLDQKLCGILIETVIKKRSIAVATLSIGLNVNQRSFACPHATSLALQTNTMWDRSFLFNRIVTLLGKYYAHLQNGIIHMLWKRYKNKLYRKHGWHRFKTQYGMFQGQIVDVNRAGQLIVTTLQGCCCTYNPKEITFIV